MAVDNYYFRSRYFSHLILMMMVQALLLPLYAPWLGRNLAEYQPSHEHIYLGQVTINHHRDLPYLPQHLHLVAKLFCDPALEGVVSLPHQDTINLGLTSLLSLICLTTILSITGNRNLVFAFVAEYILLKMVFIRPLERPPRVTS